MKKLFLALAVDDQLKEKALPLYKKLKTTFDKKEIDVRWAKPDGWHITLVFLGERHEDEIDGIWDKTIETCENTESFELKMAGIGAFPDAREARVIWVGVQKAQKLYNLQSGLEAGIGVDGAEVYVPHMTVGRLRNLKSVWDLIKPFSKTKIGTLKVKGVILYESVQAGAYPVYIPLRSVALK